jgi:hypothetical protein
MLWKAVAAALIAVAAAAPAAATTLTQDARQMHDQVLKARDHHGRPFAIVDKKAARIYVFDGRGRMQGASSVLLGQASGDDSAPEVGEHTQQGFVPLAERTTPAGRFEASAGVNKSGEHVIWVDYDSAFAIHRLRPGRSRRDREERLASPDPADHRASYGCVVVPVRFYEDVVQRWLGSGRSMVYVMRESGDAQDILGDM